MKGEGAQPAGPGRRPLAATLLGALAYFALVFGAGFLLGAIRVPFLIPRLGERNAELLELPVMVLVAVLAARFVVRRLRVPASLAVRAGMGVIALGLMLAAEWLVVVLVRGQTVAEYLASRDPVAGVAYLGALLVFGVMPVVWMLWCRWRA